MVDDGILLRMRRLFIGAVVAADTLLFGMLAILGCLLIPNGNALIWCARPWARVILSVSGARVRVAGAAGIPKDRAVLYVTNHQSLFDVLALVRALPGQYRIIAKKELFAIPVFGWALSLAGFIKIDRADREKAFRSLDIAASKIAGGMSVVVFAEGTRSPDGRLLPFKKGGFVLAIQSGCPIVPVSLSGSRAIMSRNSLDIRPGDIDVVIGRPIETGGWTMDRRDELIASVRRAVEAGFTDLKRRDTVESSSGGTIGV